MILEGKHISLRPLTLKERPQFFRWATQSDATPYWYGELYGDDIPSYVVFKLEWPDHYFDGTRPYKGRSFAILLADRAIGQINYNEVSDVDLTTELDILIAKSGDQGQGHGTDAIRTLTRYLFADMGVRRCRIEVVSRNPRAFRAYEKAGFHPTYTYLRQGIEWHVMECLASPQA
ncbi:MAG: N-acetyltransferase [Bacteroidetes bacterium]|nr:MAG: N-acetyltransferase [Bacteroidota bacterium]